MSRNFVMLPMIQGEESFKIAYPDVTYFMDRINRDRPFSISRLLHGALARFAPLYTIPDHSSVYDKVSNGTISHGELSRMWAKSHYESWGVRGVDDGGTSRSLDLSEDYYKSILCEHNKDPNFFLGISERSFWLDRNLELVQRPRGVRRGDGGGSVPTNLGDRHLLNSRFSGHDPYKKVMSACKLIQEAYSPHDEDSSPRVFAGHIIKNWVWSGEFKKYFFDQFKDDMFLFVVPERDVTRGLAERIDIPNFHYIECSETRAVEQFNDILGEIKKKQKEMKGQYKRLFFLFSIGMAGEFLISHLHKDRESDDNFYYISMGIASVMYVGEIAPGYGLGNCFCQVFDPEVVKLP